MAELEEIQVVESGIPPQTPPEKPIKLKDADRLKLDIIVQKMIKNKEPEKNIRFVVEDFKKKYGSGDSIPPEQKIATSKPKPLMDWRLAPFQTVKTTPEQFAQMGANPVVSSSDKARQTLSAAFEDIDEVIKDHLMDEADKKAAQQRQMLGIDNTAAPIYVPPLIKKQERDAQRAAIPQEAVDAIKQDPETQRFLIKKKITDYKKKGDEDGARKVQAATYLLDAEERASGKEGVIENNAKKIESGELIYNPESGQIIKPLGFGDSIIESYKSRTKDYAQGYELAGMSKEERIKFLNKELSNFDPDKPVRVPSAVAGLIGSEGTSTLKSILAGSLATMFSRSPALANSAAAAASADEIWMRSYKNEFVRSYDEIRRNLKAQNPSLPQEQIDSQAEEEANSLAKKLASSDLAANAVMTYTGYELGNRPLSFNPGSGVLKAAKKITGATIDFGKKAAPEVLSTGALSATAQAVKNQIANASGVRRDDAEGVLEAGVMGAAMPLVIGALVQAPGVAKKQFLHSFRKTPIEAVAKTTADMVEDGVLTPDQGEQAVAEVQKYQNEDAQIPDTITDEKTRVEVKDLMDEYNANKQKLAKPEEGGLHESVHKPIKERQKEIEWEINLRQQSPEDQIKLLKSRADELRTQIEEHDAAKSEGKPGKLEDRAKVKSQLTDYTKRLEDVQAKVDSPIYKAAQIIKEGKTQGYSKEILEEAANGDLDKLNGYLKEISEQVHDPLSREMAIETYGKRLVDQISEMFPEPKPPAVIMPEQNKGVTETITIKPKDGAISEQKTATLDVRQQAGDGEAMGQRNAEPEIIAGEKSREESQAPSASPEMTGITHSQMDDTAKELGLDTYEKDPEKVRIWDEQARERFAKDTDALNKLTDKLRNGEHPDKVETRMMIMHMADLKARYNKNPTPELLNEVKRTINTYNIAGREQAKALVARKGAVPVEETLADFHLRDLDANNDVPLTEQQISQSTKEFNEISAAKKAYEEKIAKLEAENARLAAEKEIKAKVPKVKTKKTKEEFSTERKQIFADIKEKLRKARGETSVVAVPYAKELITIAPDVAKLAKNLVEEGISKLDDVVKNIHAVLKEDIEDITEKDVRDIIAGEYNGKKPTRNALSAKLFELKQEAKLLNRLEALESGKETRKTEKQKRDYNKEIKDIKEKITSIEKAKREFESEKKAEYVDWWKSATAKSKEEIALQAAKTRTKKQIEDIEDAIARGDYETPKSNPVKLDKEAQDLRDKLVKVKIDREVRLIKEKYKHEKGIDKAKRMAVEIANVPRTVMSSMDLSAPLRQGLIATVAHPVIASRAFVKMLRAAKSEKVFNRYFDDLRNSPDYQLMQDVKLGLNDPLDPRLSAREEAFMSHLAEKIPVVGRLIKGSERAYVLYLNKMRVDIFRQGMDAFLADGKTPQNSPELYKALASHINNITGRGDIGGVLEGATPALNSLFFSPRLIASRLNLLFPIAYGRVPREIKMMYVKDMAKFLGFGLSLVGLSLAAGANMELDPRSSDFLKIRDGEERVDLFGGFAQYLRVISQIFSGQKKTSTGKIKELDGKGPYAEDRASTSMKFFRGKLAPVPANIVDLLAGRDVVGNEILYQWGGAEGKQKDLSDVAYKALLPMSTDDIRRVFEEHDLKAVLLLTAGMFGAGVQDYGENAKGGKSGGGGATGSFDREKREPSEPKERE